MKQYLIALIVVLLLVVNVNGISLTYQQPEDFSDQTWCIGTEAGNCHWSENATGGNSYYYSDADNCNLVTLVSPTALPMTYAAATELQDEFHCVTLYDEDLNILYRYQNTSYVNPPPFRMEMKIVDSVAYIYSNGNLVGISGTLSQLPSYVGYSTGFFDDVVWGSTESRYVFGMPDQGYWTGKQYFLMKDILNPSANGFYRVNQTVLDGAPDLIYTNVFPSSFGKPNGNNQTVEFYSPTSGVELTYNTGTQRAGIIHWNLTEFFASDANYGLYQTTITDQSDSPGYSTSEWIPYVGSGSTISFDRDNYAIGETATLTAIMAGSYYAAVTAPHIKIFDIYGTEVIDDTDVTFTEQLSGDWIGTTTYTWEEDDNEGVYYGLIYATYNGEDILMNYDTAEVTGNLIFTGYVKDAETANMIIGAWVNVTQGDTTDASTSASDGNYSTTSQFSSDVSTTIVASKTGYETYSHTFTPLYAGTIQINLTLMPINPTYGGIALGGIARTPPYNRTIDSATVTILNGSTQYLATTNGAGYYIQNYMPNGSIWDIWGNKTGFTNSTIYHKLVFGV